MSEISTEEYILPEHWLCALIYDDYSGLEQQDCIAIDKFIMGWSIPP